MQKANFPSGNGNINFPARDYYWTFNDTRKVASSQRPFSQFRRRKNLQFFSRGKKVKCWDFFAISCPFSKVEKMPFPHNWKQAYMRITKHACAETRFTSSFDLTWRVFDTFPWVFKDICILFFFLFLRMLCSEISNAITQTMELHAWMIPLRAYITSSPFYTKILSSFSNVLASQRQWASLHDGLSRFLARTSTYLPRKQSLNCVNDLSLCLLCVEVFSLRKRRRERRKSWGVSSFEKEGRRN